MLRWLRRYARVKKSEIEPSLYLVEPSQEDLLLFRSKPTIVSHVGESSTRKRRNCRERRGKGE